MNEFLIDRGRGPALVWRIAGSGLGLGAQAGAEWSVERSGRMELETLAYRLDDLGMVGDSALSYLKLALEIRLPSLTEAFNELNELNRVSLPNHLNPWAVGAGFMLAAGSLLADFKNGDWVGRWTEKLEDDHPRLEKVVKFGGRLFQLASAGAIALTPQIITKAMEMKMNAEQLAESWEGWVALMGLAALSFTLLPAAIDGIKAGAAEIKDKQPARKVILAAVKGAVRPKGNEEF